MRDGNVVDGPDVAGVDKAAVVLLNLESDTCIAQMYHNMNYRNTYSPTDVQSLATLQ